MNKPISYDTIQSKFTLVVKISEAMAIEAIKKEVLSNYNHIYKIAKVPNKENIKYIWGLDYKASGIKGHISQLGNIELNNTKIQITNEPNILLIKKPFFLTWDFSLGRINEMLKHTIKNINNPEIVQKSVVSFLI